MRFLSNLWRKLTDTALEQSTGKLEISFFESVYRIRYASGFSLAERQSLPYQIYSNVIKTSVIFFIASELWYLSSVNGLDAIIDNINVTIIHLISVYKYKSMMDCKHIYNKLAKSMDLPLFDVSSPSRKKILKYWQKNNGRYYKLLLMIGTSTLAIWYIYPLVDDIEYNLVAAVRLPVEHKTTKRYVLVYIIILIIFHFISYFVITLDMLMQTYLIHLLCQFAVLSDCFENIFVECKDEFEGFDNNSLFKSKKFRDIYLRRLGDLVEQHKFILKNAMELKQILSRPMLGQLAASGILICLVGYQITATVRENLAKFIMSLLYLLYNMYTYYVLCRWCDEIRIQSESIGAAVYHSQWENGMATVSGVKVRLMLVIARAARPVVLTAGGLYDVSLMSYTTLVKTSYSALTVLLRMSQR